jgi:hypothetical protein
MIVKSFRLQSNEKRRLQFVSGLTSISALARSVAAELVIRPKRSDSCVWSSIPALSNNSPTQSSEIPAQHPG